MGNVGQQPLLFVNGLWLRTIHETWEARCNTNNEIVKTVLTANAHEFVVKLDGGYDMDIGTGGSLLSGGQQQRIAIILRVVSR